VSPSTSPRTSAWIQSMREAYVAERAAATLRAGLLLATFAALLPIAPAQGSIEGNAQAPAQEPEAPLASPSRTHGRLTGVVPSGTTLRFVYTGHPNDLPASRSSRPQAPPGPPTAIRNPAAATRPLRRGCVPQRPTGLRAQGLRASEQELAAAQALLPRPHDAEDRDAGLTRPPRGAQQDPDHAGPAELGANHAHAALLRAPERSPGQGQSRTQRGFRDHSPHREPPPRQGPRRTPRRTALARARHRQAHQDAAPRSRPANRARTQALHRPRHRAPQGQTVRRRPRLRPRPRLGSRNAPRHRIPRPSHSPRPQHRHDRFVGPDCTTTPTAVSNSASGSRAR
jgi:hypothetical protein